MLDREIQNPRGPKPEWNRLGDSSNALAPIPFVELAVDLGRVLPQPCHPPTIPAGGERFLELVKPLAEAGLVSRPRYLHMPIAETELKQFAAPRGEGLLVTQT